MPKRSERYAIPDNRHLSQQERAVRIAAIYRPFHQALTDILNHNGEGILVTVHSFTPVFNGATRACEIGILHDADPRLGDVMPATVPADFPFRVERNVPYSASDGVTHTLKEHAVPRSWPNAMLEIRNDLIETQPQQAGTPAISSAWFPRRSPFSRLQLVLNPTRRVPHGSRSRSPNASPWCVGRWRSSANDPSV